MGNELRRVVPSRAMKRFSDAAERNKGPILDVLRRVLPARGRVLEIASGSGQHIVHFAAALPDLAFQPSDPSAEARASVALTASEAGLTNVAPPIELDVLASELPPTDAIICINMIHIAPAAATAALFAGAARSLGPGAPLVIYGPFRFDGVFSAPSNAAFDADLRRRNPEWGVRDTRDILEIASREGFDAEPPIEMPANNHVLVFRRRAPG